MGRRVLWGLTCLYVVAVALIVFWPTHVDSGESGKALARILADGHARGVVPTWFNYGKVEWLSNVAMFLPGGLLFTWLLRPVPSWLVPLGGLASSLAIETIQHFMPGRTSSPLDVLANSLGCVIGWVLALALLKVSAKRNKSTEIQP